MCTSLIYQSKDHSHFLSRTMDFAFELEASPVYLPKGYVFKSNVGSDVTYQNNYGFIGAGRKLDDYFFADGLNEKGLSVCALYFSDYAEYSPSPESGKVNIAPHELVSWLLGNMASVDELKKEASTINVVSVKNKLLDVVVPLHWIIADQTGSSVILEITQSGMSIYDNEARVMTNSPDYPWHLANLNHFSFLSNQLKPASHFYQFKPQLGELGNGSMGIPGDYTSESRFIRTVFNAEFTESGEETSSAINSIFHILSSVDIPKGVKVKADGSFDYTQYTSVMDVTHLDYYMASYQDTCPLKISLTDNLISQKEPIVFESSKVQQFKVLTPQD